MVEKKKIQILIHTKERDFSLLKKWSATINIIEKNVPFLSKSNISNFLKNKNQENLLKDDLLIYEDLFSNILTNKKLKNNKNTLKNTTIYSTKIKSYYDSIQNFIPHKINTILHFSSNIHNNNYSYHKSFNISKENVKYMKYIGKNKNLLKYKNQINSILFYTNKMELNNHTFDFIVLDNVIHQIINQKN